LWSPEFIYELFYGNRQMIGSCELNHLLSWPEDAERHQQNLWASVALGGDKFLPDIRSRNQIIMALNELEIPKFLDPALTWHSSSPEILELVRRGRRKKIKTALGFSPGEDSIKYLKRLLKLVGRDLSCRNRKRVNGSENATRFYGIAEDKLNNPIRLAVMEAVSLRYSDESARAEMRSSKWEEFLEKNKPPEMPETPTIPKLEPVSDQLNIFINLGGSDTAKTHPLTPNIQLPIDPSCPITIGQMFRSYHKKLERWETHTVKEIERCGESFVIGFGGFWELVEDLLNPQGQFSIVT
jgi:hypothetical protein